MGTQLEAIKEIKEKISEGDLNREDLIQQLDLLEDSLKSKELIPLIPSAEKYRLVSNILTDGIWEWKLETNRIFVSRRFLRIFKFGEDIPITYSLVERLIHKDDLPIFSKALEELIKKDELFDLDLRCKNGDGIYIWLNSKASAIRDQENRAIRIVGTISDITDRKEKDEKIALREKQLKRAQQTARIGYWNYDSETNRYFMSEGLLKLFNIDATEETGLERSALLKLVHPEDVELINLYYSLVREGKQVSYEHRAIIDDEIKWMKVLTEPQYWPDGQIKGATGVCQDITELKQNEIKLKEQEQHFRNFVNHVPGVVSKYRIYDDESAEIIYVSEGMENLYGISTVDFKSDPEIIWSLIKPEYTLEILENLRRCSHELTHWEMIWEVKTIDGFDKWIKGMGTPLKGEGFTDWNLLLFDITKEKEKETLLLEFENLFQISTDYFAILDSEGNFKHLNAALKAISSFDPYQKEKNDSFLAHVHPDDQIETRYYIEQLGLGNIKSAEFTNRTVVSGNKYIWLDWKIKCEDETSLLYAVGRDISDKKSYEKELKQQEFQMRFLAESAIKFSGLSIDEDIFSVITDRLCSLLEGKAYCTITEVNKDQKSWHVRGVSSHSAALNKILREGATPMLGLSGTYNTGEKNKVSEHLEQPIYIGDSLRIVYDKYLSEEFLSALTEYMTVGSIYSIALRGATEPAAIISIVQENTELKNKELLEAFCKQASIALQKHLLQKDLVESHETKNKLFSFISHDLKSPFISLINLLHLLEHSLADLEPKTIEDMVTQLSNKTKTIYSVFENMLTWSSNQSGLLTRTNTIFDLQQVLRDASDILEFAASNKNIVVEITSTTDNSKIKADREMINSVARNLLSNAIKFTHRGGKIKILLYDSPENEDILTCCIEDNGTGIKAEDKVKIFSARKQIMSNGTENEKGTGIGLALCKDFIEKNEGDIWFESEENNGTKFFFSLKREK